LGFRTANLACTPGVLAPATGVYAVFLEVVDGPLAGSQFAAVANLGTNPTFTPTPGDNHGPRLEVHALDADLGEQLYGCAIEVGFVARLRDEQRFDGPEALKFQISADIGHARQVLAPPAQASVHAAKLRTRSAS
ncbi:MAG: riboflavin kinase, partial [Nannocystaceae bacterium]